MKAQRMISIGLLGIGLCIALASGLSAVSRTNAAAQREASAQWKLDLQYTQSPMSSAQLGTAFRPGHAMRAENPPPGTVLAKALGSLDASQATGIIPVLVTLQ